MNWQPIDAAPRDGTEILVTGFNCGDPSKGRHYCVASWMEGFLLTPAGFSGDADETRLSYLDLWQLIVPPEQG